MIVDFILYWDSREYDCSGNWKSNVEVMKNKVNCNKFVNFNW